MKKSTLALVLLAIASNTFLWLMLKTRPGISAENGPMENFQLVCLLLGFVLWLSASFRSENKAERILLVAFALFALSFFILEIDTRKIDLPLVNKFLRGKFRDGALLCLWLGAAIAFFKNRKAGWSEFRAWLQTASAVCMIASGLFWIISGLNDKHLLWRKDLFLEELMEVNATLLMLFSATLFLLNQQRRKLEKPANLSVPRS